MSRSPIKLRLPDPERKRLYIEIYTRTHGKRGPGRFLTMEGTDDVDEMADRIITRCADVAHENGHPKRRRQA